MELEKARAIAEELKDGLEGECYRIEIAGDVRRHRIRVRKIKILCVPKPLEGVSIPELEPVDPNKWRHEIEEFGDYDAIDEWFDESFRQGFVDVPRKGCQTFTHTKKSIIHVPTGMAVDILSTDERGWPVALVMATGGAKTIRVITAAAQEKAWRFQSSRDGFDKPGGHITCKTEREVFEAVGLPYLPPEQRE